MLGPIGRIFDDEAANARAKMAVIYIVLITANVLSWAWH